MWLAKALLPHDRQQAVWPLEFRAELRSSHHLGLAIKGQDSPSLSSKTQGFSGIQYNLPFSPQESSQIRASQLSSVPSLRRSMYSPGCPSSRRLPGRGGSDASNSPGLKRECAGEKFYLTVYSTPYSQVPPDFFNAANQGTGGKGCVFLTGKWNPRQGKK